MYLKISDDCLSIVDPQQYVMQHPVAQKIKNLYWGEGRDWDLASGCLQNLLLWIQALPLISSEPFQKPYGAAEASLSMAYEIIPILKNRMLFFELPIKDRQSEIRRVKWAYFITACLSQMKNLMASMHIRSSANDFYRFESSLHQWLIDHATQSKTLLRSQIADRLSSDFWVMNAALQIVPTEIWSEIGASCDKKLLPAVKAVIEGNVSEAKSLNAGLIDALVLAERKIQHREEAYLVSSSHRFSVNYEWMICEAIADLFSDELCLDSESGQQLSSRLVTTRDGQIFLDKEGFFELLSRKASQKFIQLQWTSLACLRMAVKAGIVALDNQAFWEKPFYSNIERRGRTDLASETKACVLLVSPRLFIAKTSRWAKLLEKLGLESQESTMTMPSQSYPTENEWLSFEGPIAEKAAQRATPEEFDLVKRGREGFFSRLKEDITQWLKGSNEKTPDVSNEAPVIAEKLRAQKRREEQKLLEVRTLHKSDFELGINVDPLSIEETQFSRTSKTQQNLPGFGDNKATLDELQKEINMLSDEAKFLSRELGAINTELPPEEPVKKRTTRTRRSSKKTESSASVKR